jgi:hypothetical protein
MCGIVIANFRKLKIWRWGVLPLHNILTKLRENQSNVSEVSTHTQIMDIS